MMGSFGAAQILILAVVVLLLFGHRLPSVMRSMGQSLTEFRRGLHAGDSGDGQETA